MVVWKSVRFTKVEGESRGGEMKNFNIDLNVTDLKAGKGDVTVGFTHNVNYGDDVGFIRFTGLMVAGASAAELKEIQEKWADKKLPSKFASELTNAIMYNCEINGVLVTRVLNMPAPVIPPRIGVEEQ